MDYFYIQSGELKKRLELSILHHCLACRVPANSWARDAEARCYPLGLGAQTQKPGSFKVITRVPLPLGICLLIIRN